jgi:hypothetical protein
MDFPAFSGRVATGDRTWPKIRVCDRSQRDQAVDEFPDFAR